MLVVVAASLVASAPSPAPSVDHVMEKLDDLFRSKASVARMEITVVSPRTTRKLQLRAWTRGEDRSLVVIEQPPREAGITSLRVGENLWNHLPKVARTIRVPPSMMLASWMGTDFTNDDLVHESSFRDDYESKLDGWNESPAGWRIVSVARPGVVARWARVEILVSADDFLPIQMKHFDRKGRLARTMTFDEVKVMGGRRIPTRTVLTPVDPPGNRTELRYLEVQFDADVPDETFSLSRLERGS